MVAGHRQHSDQHTGCFHWWTLRILKRALICLNTTSSKLLHNKFHNTYIIYIEVNLSMIQR